MKRGSLTIFLEVFDPIDPTDPTERVMRKRRVVLWRDRMVTEDEARSIFTKFKNTNPWVDTSHLEAYISYEPVKL